MISERVELAYATRPYERRVDDPCTGRCRSSRSTPPPAPTAGRVTMLKLLYEPLAPGPVGAIFELDATVEDASPLAPAELDHPHVLLEGGYRPSITDPKFHQQMV